MKRFAIDKIAQELSSRLHEWVEQRIMRDRTIDWQKAYAHRGRGSTRPRRRDIEFIYSEAAPIPGGRFYGSFNEGLPAAFNFLFNASLFWANRAGCTQ